MGCSPTRVDMFKVCYTKKNGEPSNSEAADKMREMDKMVSKLPTGVDDSVGRNNVFAQVIGPDRAGKVQMYGLGVSPSDLWGDFPSKSTCHCMVLEHQHQMAEMVEKYNQQEQQIQDQAKEIAEVKAMLMQQRNSSSSESRYHSMSPNNDSRSNNSRTNNNIGASFHVGADVELFSYKYPNKSVAFGRIQYVDPTSILHGCLLGTGWCEVLVEVSNNNGEPFPRPYNLIQTMFDAIGSPIAWPTNKIKLMQI